MPSLPPLSRVGSRPDGPASPCSPLLRPNFMTKCYPIAADLQTTGRAVHLSICSCMPLLAMHLSTFILRYAHSANCSICIVCATSRFDPVRPWLRRLIRGSFYVLPVAAGLVITNACDLVL